MYCFYDSWQVFGVFCFVFVDMAAVRVDSGPRGLMCGQSLSIIDQPKSRCLYSVGTPYDEASDNGSLTNKLVMSCNNWQTPALC